MNALLYETIKPLDSVVYFLTETLKELGWYKQKEEFVMDVGCGPGHVTSKYILPLFQDFEKFIAVDYSPSMIETARSNNYHPKIDYIVSNFEDKSDITCWFGQVTKLVSIHCFNWLKNQEKCFQNVYDLLQPGAEAAFYFVLKSDFYAAVVDIYNDPKWSRYFEGVDNRVAESHYKKYDSRYYRKILENIGFTLILCRDELKVNPLSSEKEAKDLYYSLTVLVHHVPLNLRDEFRDDLFEYVLKNGGITEDGTLVHKAVTLELVVKKPK
ncbi:juvenile hormone acid O-methyltransferase-like [Argiope bruennichi]|uniref:Juvenile hormone acid O-methyltransferase like protein n=1 Tax=Argiope bruennichi TaxID=94029 RepID=A0A8T0EVW2_ARGBR|nr:juvenile hormone acid O-methyltransferase-like [Argiope bruennichi]KAF8778435.1 Juvenile hormone acid O-methyltransferase like protein [Argiope bruennichi]